MKKPPVAKVTSMYTHLDEALATWQSSVRPWAAAAGVSKHDLDVLTNALHTAVNHAANLRRQVEAGGGRNDHPPTAEADPPGGVGGGSMLEYALSLAHRDDPGDQRQRGV